MNEPTEPYVIEDPIDRTERGFAIFDGQPNPLIILDSHSADEAVDYFSAYSETELVLLEQRTLLLLRNIRAALNNTRTEAHA